MSCIEHECLTCGRTEFNNFGGTMECCGIAMSHTFDEPSEDHDDDDNALTDEEGTE